MKYMERFKFEVEQCCRSTRHTRGAATEKARSQSRALPVLTQPRRCYMCSVTVSHLFIYLFNITDKGPEGH